MLENVGIKTCLNLLLSNDKTSQNLIFFLKGDDMTANTEQHQLWPKWLKPSQAHQYISVADNTFIKRYVQTGKVKAYPTEHGIRYDRDEIDEAVRHYYD